VEKNNNHFDITAFLTVLASSIIWKLKCVFLVESGSTDFLIAPKIGETVMGHSNNR